MPIRGERGATLRRGRTLVRNDRVQAAAPMIAKDKRKLTPWVVYSKIISFWAPGFLLSKLGGMSDPSMQQAWREKIALVSLIVLVCCFVVYVTIFLAMTFCPEKTAKKQSNVIQVEDKNYSNVIGIKGLAYSTDSAHWTGQMQLNLTVGQDLTSFFNVPIPNECKSSKLQQFRAVEYDVCNPNNGNSGCPLGDVTNGVAANGLVAMEDGKDSRPIGYDWSNVKDGYFVINGEVLNLNPYLNSVDQPKDKDMLDEAIFAAANSKQVDATLLFQRTPEMKDAVDCLTARFKAGVLAKDTPGCFAVNLFNYIALIIIGGIVLTRFMMAVIFQYFLSWQLVRRPPRNKVRPLSYNAAAPWTGKKPQTGGAAINLGKGEEDELFTVMLVTCYSEGEESIKGTCDSLCGTDFSDARKLLFIVADGIIKGSGNDRTTPDICIDLIEQEDAFREPLPCSYLAVAAGSKQHNMCKVYCGYYRVGNHRTPTLVVVKSGTPEEQDAPKPGNRGKRDSQMILMNFFSRAIFNERMTPLDYDLFRKVHHLMGATPDLFEIVLMVDADTKVYPDSLRLLVNCMNNDQLIMGLCGETKIANKRDSWVTAIQVFEYYISHHLSKAFESVFGGVTCLPGCFCMYRLKARKGDDWVPILTKSEICHEYSQNVVETLHEKNLLLLGEDRFLTTLMLRNFPSRKMMFMPQAVCKTLVPDEFKVLLSQRRRWINSTVHNLLELVLVRNLCGTFCLSMQFSIMLDLVGTVALPVAIVLTYILIVRACMTKYNSVSAYLPLAMLILVLFLPAVLILITTRKWIYVAWMVVYLIALPIWNFVLPTYAYWHFDDFSWGETRKVQGEGKDKGHGDAGGTFDAAKVPMKRWEDYERKRLRSIRRKERDQQFDDGSSYQMPLVDDSAKAGLLKNSVEDSMYYESHPGYSFMGDSSANSIHESSGTIGNFHHPQQYEMQSYPPVNNNGVYVHEPSQYGDSYNDFAYQGGEHQYGGYDDYSQHQQPHQGSYESQGGYMGHQPQPQPQQQQQQQQPPSRQRPGGPRDYS
ncbi:hypothetical protein GGI25_002117 [Coemansia spiralis]|uniref:chitin synthase n=2 Tax=Coemansia TaxID=4863 RepID=A0A9W8KZP1_9FUNG|nr:hypothetical protein EDC05_001037 [Coemansia umbellata]KAJ2625600.1 hypothetical protein GGI26_000400 [Coemansia sp. RSA 1358]KAJ2678732.1 hypothetical protein GGI25_002117 [Coemansia spiralis]